jgi:ADP-heptose:LPS heptosyltransferase
MAKKRILIFRTEQLGDFIATIPIFNEIRKKYPYSELTIILKKMNYGFAKNLKIFDKIIVYEDPLSQRNVSFLKIIRNPLNVLRLLKHFLWLRRKSYNTVIEFSGRRYNKLRLRFIKAKQKISANPEDIRKIDEIERLFKVSWPLKVFMPKTLKFLNKNDDAMKETRKIIRKYKLDTKKIVMVHPLTPLDEKNWPLKKFTELFKKFEKENVKFVLIGTEKESRIVQPYFKNSKNVLNIMGKLSLLGTYEMIKKSDLFLGLDSGPLHLAKFTKTPLIAIFGNEDLEYTRWGPKRKIDKGFEKNNLNELLAEEVAREVFKKLKIK